MLYVSIYVCASDSLLSHLFDKFTLLKIVKFNPPAFFLSLDNKSQMKVFPSASNVPTPPQPWQDVIHSEHSEPNLHLCELAQCSASRF